MREVEGETLLNLVAVGLLLELFAEIEIEEAWAQTSRAIRGLDEGMGSRVAVFVLIRTAPS